MNDIILRQLTKTFHSEAEELTVLRGLDACLPMGHSVAITGESGSGKSTLLSLIGGLDAPSSGSIECDSWRLNELDEDGLSDYRRSYVGFIFQFHFLLRDFTVLENVMMGALVAGQRRRQAKDGARRLLDEVGILNKADYYPNKLSGGERQRVAVARSLVHQPSLILADEPTGNLDDHNRDTVAELLLSMVARYGKTLLLVTHDLDLAAACNSHYSLRSGELSLYGQAQDNGVEER